MSSNTQRSSRALVFVALLLAGACTSTDRGGEVGRTRANAGPAPLPGATLADELISPGETHFAHLWKLTHDVDNAAEGYWSFAGDRLCYQAMPRGVGCDRIFITGAQGPVPISNGRGVTTCSYFLPSDRQLIYASTHAAHQDCPPRPDMSQGYVWPVWPEYDIYLRDLASGQERAFTSSFGYDAEATVSPLGDRIVFTSSRSGDLELWTCDLEGRQPSQVTHAPGYDGGAFFSHDGNWLVFRATSFTPGKETEEIAAYQKLLLDWKVKPTRMEIMLIRPDGSERRQVTKLGKASFAPYFFPDDQRIIFASNHLDTSREGRGFDLFACDLYGRNIERVTTYELFDSFPMFSPDGRWLAFASNRGGSHPHETNLFIAEWR